MENYRFLTKEEVLCIHRDMVRRHGGTLSIWDTNKLDAAVEAPKAGFGGIRVHKTISEVAAAYWFHISQAHAFESANKRTAFEACVTFLYLNGHRVICEHSKIIEVGVDLAIGKLTESDLVAWLEEYIFSV